MRRSNYRSVESRMVRHLDRVLCREADSLAKGPKLNGLYTHEFAVERAKAYLLSARRADEPSGSDLQFMCNHGKLHVFQGTKLGCTKCYIPHV